ncbi:SdpI family protein [Phosphitispora fastidiosa]|uniref:SdpI family protein n=1 Tax=Phosphitispora fastidiosa TaxID=2837202 RepID=UPI001E35432A|nr:SdpI family protein [Phosphitispora fastidiosa]MBU7006162.1 putative membrane protein [Phosphitispora fastidiosa]
MKLSKTVIALILLSIIATLFIYQSLPDTIPLHWNIKGEVDNTGGKNFVFVTALLPLALYLLMKFAPKIDPKKASYDKHMGSYQIITISVVLMMIGIHWVSIVAAMGYNIDVGMFVKIGVGLLFIVLGNVMPKLRHNYFVGIRTPWTLANEDNWRKTHRFGGYAFVLAGLTFFVSGFFHSAASAYITFGITIALLISILVYSYVAFKKAV